MKYFFSLVLVSMMLTIPSNIAAQRSDMQLKQPGFIEWRDDDHMVVRTFNESRELVTALYNCRSGEITELPDYTSSAEKALQLLPPDVHPSVNMAFSSDRQSLVIAREGGLWYYDHSGGKKLNTGSGESVNMRYAPGDRRLAYTRNRDLYVYDLDLERESRLTFDATDRVYNGWASWVYYEEILGRPSRYAAFWWSPDGNRLAYLHTDDNPVPLFHVIALDEGDGLHGRLESVPYPCPGDPNPRVKMGIVELSTAKTTWVKTDESADQYIAWPSWTPDSRHLLVQVLNRDQNDLRFILADAASGSYTEVYRETRPTWVEFSEDIYIMNDGSGFILRSCQNDWYNLYYYGWDGRLLSRITDFDWKVVSLDKVDEKRRELYFTGTGPEGLERHLYRVRLDGSRLTLLNPGRGVHKAIISPEGSWIADSWSNNDDPGAMNIINKKGEVTRQFYRPENPAFDPEKEQRSEIVTVKTSDGLFEMPVLVTYPAGFKPDRKYPVVFTVYGGPDAGSITDRWLGHKAGWYGENGIITVNAEHRGSGFFGKKGLDYMYRSLGKWEISDYSDVVKWLRTKPWVDSSRIGITGGSYGGYTTCMALTRGAEYWSFGVADYSVTDWRLYDNVYTERYMDTPEDNPEGYREGSVMTYIPYYKGKLLLRHGDIDDNVHIQNTIRLVSALQDAGKPFELMIYPGGRHGWGGAKRIYMTNEANNFWQRNFFGDKINR